MYLPKWAEQCLFESFTVLPIYPISYERSWWKQLSFCLLTLKSSFHQILWCVRVGSRHWEVKRTTERAMSQRIKWFSAKTYKDRGCPIQVFVNQDISRMYSILRRILFSCLDIFGILYEILLEKQPILGKNSQRKRKPSMLFSTQRAQNLTLIKRLAKRDTIAHTDISPWNISSYEFVLCLLCLVHNEDGLWCKDIMSKKINPA